MKALILAAGKGSRLYPHTEKVPKCMVAINGKPMIDWQVEALRSAGVHDIVVVGGYKSEVLSSYLEDKVSHFTVNELFADTNMVYSFLLARDFFGQDLIVSYSDIVYSPEIIKKLISSQKDYSVVVDLEWKNCGTIAFRILLMMLRHSYWTPMET